MLELVLSQTRRFAEREIDGAAIDRAGRIPEGIIRRAADLGLFGLTIPEGHGGLGLPLGQAGRVVSELALHDRSVATMIGLHAGLGTRAIVELATDDLKKRLLPKLASGEHIGAFCATEPGAGSDLTAIRTTGTVVGDAIELSGEKSYVTNGALARVFTVLVRTPSLGGARGTSLLYVPGDAAGLTVGSEERKLGLRGSSTVTVALDGVRVPLEHVLGTPGQGLRQAHRVLEWGRTLLSAGCVGTARAALEATLTHVSSRRQFGRPLSAFGASQAHLSTMASRLFAMEALLEVVGALEERRAPIAVTSAIAKVFCSESAFDTCDRALQLHGALGYLEDSGVPRLLRDCRVTRIFEGANDVLLVHIGAALVGSPTSTDRRLHVESAAGLEAPAGGWTELDQRLSRATERVRREHGVGAVRHQLVLQRLARAHSALTASSACLARAARAATPRITALANAAMSRLHQEASEHLEALERAEDDEARDAAVAGWLLGERATGGGARSEARTRREAAE